MAYKVAIGKSAQADIKNVLEWYAGESLIALEKFVQGFYLRLDDLSERPDSFGLVRQRPKFRKVKIKRFPYFIVYRIDSLRSRVFVAALIHEKRNPEIWVKKLR